MTRVPELEKLSQEVEAISDRAVTLCEGLSEEQLCWRARVGQWSIAENLLHLRVTTQTFLPAVESAIENAKQRNLFSNGPFSLGILGKLLVWYVEPPPVLRLPAPRPLEPLLRGPAVDVLPQFLQSQQIMLDKIEESQGIDLSRTRFVSPLSRLIRMNLLSMFSVFCGHGRRHIWQASNVRRRLPAR